MRVSDSSHVMERYRSRATFSRDHKGSRKANIGIIGAGSRHGVFEMTVHEWWVDAASLCRSVQRRPCAALCWRRLSSVAFNRIAPRCSRFTCSYTLRMCVAFARTRHVGMSPAASAGKDRLSAPLGGLQAGDHVAGYMDTSTHRRTGTDQWYA
jgi:hypothetical protein